MMYKICAVYSTLAAQFDKRSPVSTPGHDQLPTNRLCGSGKFGRYLDFLSTIYIRERVQPSRAEPSRAGELRPFELRLGPSFRSSQPLYCTLRPASLPAVLRHRCPQTALRLGLWTENSSCTEYFNRPSHPGLTGAMSLRDLEQKNADLESLVFDLKMRLVRLCCSTSIHLFQSPHLCSTTSPTS